MLRPTTWNRAAADPALQQAGRPLRDAVARIGRAPRERVGGWVLLGLHLSRLPHPGPRAHHRLVAAAMLDDAAVRGGGQVFALGGELALLFRPGDGGRALLAVLARLFDVHDAALLFSVWALPAAARPAMAWLDERIAVGDRGRPEPDPAPGPADLVALQAEGPAPRPAVLLRRQTAVLLRPGRPEPVVPLFRELALPPPAIAGSPADPFLLGHVATLCDPRLLAALRPGAPGGGLLALGQGTTALHVNLTVSGILSAGFAAFADRCAPVVAAGLRVGVEVPFADAFADITHFILARERVRLAGLRLVLDDVAHPMLAVASPVALEPSLVKLDWAPALPTLGQALRPGLAALGPARVVLNRADTEAAVAWGLSHGIARFQGRYVDALLAARRLRACPAASACTVRHCTDRAAATAPADRAGCRNLALLDLAAPAPARPRAPVPA